MTVQEPQQSDQPELSQAPQPHPICTITLLQTGTAREFYARVESGQAQLVTGPWETRDALLAYVTRWLCGHVSATSPYEPGNTCFEGAYDQEGS